MIQARPTGAKIRPPITLSDEQIARQMRSRRRQLEILRRIIAEQEGRSDG